MKNSRFEVLLKHMLSEINGIEFLKRQEENIGLNKAFYVVSRTIVDKMFTEPVSLKLTRDEISTICRGVKKHCEQLGYKIVSSNNDDFTFEF